MTLDRCGCKGYHDGTGGEAVRMPIKLWEPVEKSSWFWRTKKRIPEAPRRWCFWL